MVQSGKIPLADRMRPRNLEEFLGQEEIVGPGRMLRRAIETDNLPSIIFWGPPGSGKTTLAQIIAKATKSEFLELSAVTSGLKDLRGFISAARNNDLEDKKTILFIDEIHRWNKKQQDALLPYVEKGIITLIGATTENPGFEVRPALLSRAQVFILKPLSDELIVRIINKALKDKDRGLGGERIKIKAKTIEILAHISHGDARTALNVLSYATSINKKIGEKEIKEALQKPRIAYDKNGEEHYNIISALHKSMRGSDPNAALYWLARMIEGGEDPIYIARRLVRFASEDIGLANSRALEQAVAAYQACTFIGLPECNVILSQAVVYMAKCKKSNALYRAYKQAQNDAREYGTEPVPLHLRNASNKLMKDIGYGQDYKYSPNHNYQEKQTYFPDKLKNKRYFN